MKNQPGTRKNHENRPGTKNNQPGTMNTHENRPGTINKQKPYKQTDRTFLLYIDSESCHLTTVDSGADFQLEHAQRVT